MPKFIEVTIEGVIYLVEHWNNIAICELVANIEKAVENKTIKTDDVLEIAKDAVDVASDVINSETATAE